LTRISNNKAIVHSRLHPSSQLTVSRPTSGLYRWAKFGWNLRCYACRVLYRHAHNEPLAVIMKAWRHPQNRKYVTSQRRQRRTEQRPQATCTKNFVKFSHGFQVMRPDRQTYSSQYLATLPGQSNTVKSIYNEHAPPHSWITQSEPFLICLICRIVRNFTAEYYSLVHLACEMWLYLENSIKVFFTSKSSLAFSAARQVLGAWNLVLFFTNAKLFSAYCGSPKSSWNDLVRWYGSYELESNSTTSLCNSVSRVSNLLRHAWAEFTAQHCRWSGRSVSKHWEGVSET